MRRTYLIWCLFLSFQLLWAQSPKDKKAADLFKIGETAFQKKDYSEARTAFTQTINLGHTAYASAATYMTGLCYFYEKNRDKSLAYLQDLITQYPQSKFVSDAKYHKGLLMLESPDSREGGLFLLMNVAEDEKNSEYLRKDADKSAKNFLFSTTTYFLKNYFEKVRTTYRPWVAEALCYQYYRENKFNEIQEFLKTYERTVGKPTEGMLKCKKENPISNPTESNVPAYKRANEVRIALILPFSASNYSEEKAELNFSSRIAMEYLDGLLWATEKEKMTGPEKVIIQVFDSQKDSILTERMLQSQVKPFNPDVIIGDIFTSPSAAIVRFAQTHGIVHFIPFAPVDKLVEQPNYSYMMMPGHLSQSAGMAKIAFDKMKFKKVYVISDADPILIQASELFIDYGNKKNANCTHKTLEPGKAYKLLADYSAEIIDDKYDAVYLNSSRQDHYEILLGNLITGDTAQVCLLGHGEMQNFTKIAPEKFFYYNSILPIYYNFTHDSIAYTELYDAFYQVYQTQPSVYVCQGYDMIRFLLKAIRENPNLPLPEALEKMTPYKGILQNTFFGKSKTNASVQFQRYSNKKIEWVKAWD